jgi:hypothetical protein
VKEGYWLSGRGVARRGPSGSAAPGGRVQGMKKLILGIKKKKRNVIFALKIFSIFETK